MNLAIKAENISKQYRLGQVGTGTISHDLNRWWAKIRGKEDPYLKIGESNDRSIKGNSEYVWSLKDVNFEIEQGTAVGIIGRNGAGKSTLLKLLSKVTQPTTGSFKVNGRIASLLEVGTGFNPEMTGRENVYLNGAILGMTRSEIRSKFDEIVDFSGCERYIDTPVKRYSSGMYVRLAFAVAAHLESEILIVDEVLAVGDSEFQKKCLGKMGDVSKGEGRTVLFVSHNMAAVKQLCNKGIVLEKGMVTFSGGALESVDYYQKSSNIVSYFEHKGGVETALGNEFIKILKFNVKPVKNNHITISSGLELDLEIYNYVADINLDATFELRNLDDLVVFQAGMLISENNDSKIGYYEIKGEIPPHLLNSGVYNFRLIFGKNQKEALYVKDEIIQFEILNESLGNNTDIIPGIIRPQFNFSLSHRDCK
ncbi:ATP-binding cassette domain-containing protein [Apibacter muscae]|uniref:ABC transporter ATP-binding protein n=1 Tax=Apibacter muscae TaxID=2509004 RepID=UPI0011ABB658|nr:ABC transporter ATP-binding protein [Apibacter muscae]TWP25133.1 ATP-binding cassette domain-containing protein [Apibacter muscae]